MKEKKKRKTTSFLFVLCIISTAHDGLPQRSGQGCCLKVTLKGENGLWALRLFLSVTLGHLDPKEKKVLEPLRRGWIPPGAGDISLLPDYIVRAGASCLLQLWARPWQWQCSSHDSKKKLHLPRVINKPHPDNTTTCLDSGPTFVFCPSKCEWYPPSPFFSFFFFFVMFVKCGTYFSNFVYLKTYLSWVFNHTGLWGGKCLLWHSSYVDGLPCWIYRRKDDKSPLHWPFLVKLGNQKPKLICTRAGV